MTAHTRANLRPGTAPEWTQADADAVLAIYHELLAEGGRPGGTSHGRAARSYFSRTGNVSHHGHTGYAAGCHCPVCRLAKAAVNRRRYQP